MRAWLLSPLLIVACSIDLEPLATGSDDGGGSSGSGGNDASTDACSAAWCSGNGGSGASGGSAGASTGGGGDVDSGASGGQAGMSGGPGVGGVSGTGGGGSGGTGPPFACFNVYQIETIYDGQKFPCDSPDPNACRCLGCYPVCEDQYGPVSDCVCPICAGSPGCQNFCYLDGLCDPYAEACTCADCKSHPLCP